MYMSHNIPIRSKLPQVGTTIFAVMSSMANEYGAINLSQGFPDFEVDPVLIGLVTKYMKKGYNQYAPMAGIPALREAIAAKANRLYQAGINPDTEITLTAGGTQALYTALAAVVRENDEVIVFEPCYDSYVPAIEANGAKEVYITLEAPDYKIPWEKVKKVINSRTRMMIFNTPHNPTGTVWTEEDIKQLHNIVKDSQILILSDEVYEHIIFDGQQHESILKYPELFQRSFVCFSFGKVFHATGWKMGYCIAPEYLMKEFRKIHQFLVFSVNTPIQYALAEYLQDENNYLKLPAFYQAKRDYFLDLIKDSRFTFSPAGGSYFQLLNYSKISDEAEYDFAVRLTKENGIASIPTSSFYNNNNNQNMLRFCFAKENETLEQAAEILNKI